jgi:hypothetical protein
LGKSSSVRPSKGATGAYQLRPSRDATATFLMRKP